MLARITEEERWPSVRITCIDDVIKIWGEEDAEELLSRDGKQYVDIPEVLIRRVKKAEYNLKRAERQILNYYKDAKKT